MRFDISTQTCRALAAVFLAAGAATSSSAQGSAAATLPRYDVDVTFDRARGTIDATVSIQLPAGSAGTEYKLLLGRTYAISALSAEGAAIDSVTLERPFPARQLTVRRTGTSAPIVRVRYAGPLFEFARPAINVVNDSLVEVSIDSFWLPYNAALGSPMVVAARVRGLGGMTVASNVRSRTEGDIVRLESGPAGTADLTLVGTTGSTIRNAGRFQMLARDHDSPIASYYREHGDAGIRSLERLLGAMPGSTATLAMVRRENGSGYARPGYVIVTDRANVTPGPGQAKFVVHEFAHLWFSRASLTGEDYWLVETPAEYLGLRYVRDALGAAAFESLMAPKRETAAKAPPILGNGRAPDPAIYARGPLLFFDLEQRIGRERMNQLMSRLGREPVHTTAFFLSALRAVADEATATEFEVQLRKAP